MRRDPSKPPKPLTDADQIFCREVALGAKQSDAYRTAFPQSLKWTDKTVWSKASHFANRPLVVARIAELRAHSAKKIGEITVERIQQELARLALFDPQKMYDAEGNLIPLHLMDEDTRRAIAGIDNIPLLYRGKVVKNTSKVRAWDKKGALDSLARIKDMFKDKLELTGDFAERLVKARERAARNRSAKPR